MGIGLPVAAARRGLVAAAQNGKYARDKRNKDTPAAGAVAITNPRRPRTEAAPIVNFLACLRIG